MASNILVNTFVTGATDMNEATALSNFVTAMSAVTTYQNVPITVIAAACDMVVDQGQLYYKFWAFIQYYSA